MSQVFSEINKIVNVYDPQADTTSSGATVATDIVNMENYKNLTYIVHTGASAASTPVITVLAGETSTGATTAIAYKYRTQIAGTGGASGTAGSDVPGALTDATTAGFSMTTSKAGGVYIIEVDPSTAAAADATDQTYDHITLLFTISTTNASHIWGVLAVLSEPRYPQDVLVTAID